MNVRRSRNMALKAHAIAFSKPKHTYLSFVRDMVEGLINSHGKHSLTFSRQMSVTSAQSKRLKVFRKPITDVRHDNAS